MLSSQRSKFTLSSGHTYLNNAYMSPLLKSVEKAGIEGVKRKRNPYTISPADFFVEAEHIRTEFAKLINTDKKSRIALTPAVSYGMANVAKNVPLSRGENIIVAEQQFPSNYYPWQSYCAEKGAKLIAVSPPPLLEERGKKWNERILEAINKKTKIVALGCVHWVDGTLFQLQKIRKRTREVGALLVIDGTQSVGALPFDVRAIQPDALVCASYKSLMGPYSLGVSYYGPYFEQGKPIEESWINRKRSENFGMLLDYEPAYRPGAMRYEVGERSNFILLPMLLAALKQINQWGPENIQSYCDTITSQAIEEIRECGYWVEEESNRGKHLFGIRAVSPVNLKKVKDELSKNKIAVSFRGDAIRVSPHVYNTEKDMMKLARVLKKMSSKKK